MLQGIAREFFFWKQTCPRKIKDDDFSQRQQILEQNVSSLRILGLCGTLELHSSSLMSLGVVFIMPHVHLPTYSFNICMYRVGKNSKTYVLKPREEFL